MKAALGLAVLTVAMASAMSMGQARADVEQETFSSNPSARCQPALPVFDGKVRKRPLAMANEGTTNVTINCAFETEIGQSTAQLISVFVSNSNAGAIDVTCTGISGWEFRSDISGASLNEYVPVTITVPAGAQSDPFQWADADFTNGTGGLITVACTLPPGTAINDSYVDLLTDDAPTTP